MAHDIQNPLTAVRVLADLALEEATGEMRQDLVDLLAAVDLAVAQTDGLAFYARRFDTTGHQRLVVEVVQRAMAREAFARAQLTGTSRRLVCAGPFERLFTSVLLNAVQLTQTAVRVTVGGDCVEVLHVGRTITAAQCASLLAVDHARTVRSGALGLWGASDAMNALGGSLETAQLAAGFTVRLVLPPQ